MILTGTGRLVGRLGPFTRTPRWGERGFYFVAFNATNAVNYGYLVLMAFFLGTAEYGLFGALFGMIYLSSALGNTIKLAVGRHVAHLEGLEDGSVGRNALMDLSLWAGGISLVTGGLFLALTPAIALLFDSPMGPLFWTILAVALAVFLPATYGLLQGLQKFTLLGLVMLAGAVFRVVAGVAFVAASSGVTGAMAGVAIGYLGAAVLTLPLVYLLLPRPNDSFVVPAPVRAPSMDSLGTSLLGSLCIASATSVDVGLVRLLLPEHDAGVFTGIAVLGRVVLFASVSVPFIALPIAATRQSRGERSDDVLWASLLVTAFIATSAAAGLAFLSFGLGLSLVGETVPEGAQAWYLAGMVAFALLIVFVYYHVAIGDRSYVVRLTAGILAQVLIVLAWHDSLLTVAQVIFATNIVLLIASAGWCYGRQRRAARPRAQASPAH